MGMPPFLGCQSRAGGFGPRVCWWRLHPLGIWVGLEVACRQPRMRRELAEPVSGGQCPGRAGRVPPHTAVTLTPQIAPCLSGFFRSTPCPPQVLSVGQVTFLHLPVSVFSSANWVQQPFPGQRWACAQICHGPSWCRELGTTELGAGNRLALPLPHPHLGLVGGWALALGWAWWVRASLQEEVLEGVRL